jgi:uncharacterized protein YcfJ
MTLALLCAGCATQRPWTPTVDTFGSSNAQFVSRDMEECRNLALQASGHAPEQAVRGAVTGGLVGAAAGVAIGSALGGRAGAGRGALVGGAAGGIGMGAASAAQTEEAFKRAFTNCMRQRGHNVIN